MRVKAEVTAAFKAGTYTAKSTHDCTEFFIDSALDTDTDSFQVTIGDFNNDLTATLHRDSEVRVNLFIEGNPDGNFKLLQTGIADEVAWDDEGTMVINGRDFTSIAVDSKHPPARFKLARPEKIVAKEAREIGVGSSLRLGDTKKWPVFKELATDGSESYWEFWYRLYRKRRMWLWAEPDGILVASTLNYDQKPSYYFGSTYGLSSKYNKFDFIPVESMSWRANKQQRVATVYVIGNRGDKTSFVAKAIDPTMKHWVKRPNAIITSKSAHGPGEARAEAWEELFESKVGATEISLTIADPGLIIRQNRMCFVNIPDANVRGTFYVVGTRIVGSVEQGLFQEVRLREENYAISRRVPTDPKLIQGPGQDAMFGPVGPGGMGPNNPAGTISEAVSQAIGRNWGQYFVEAADKQRGPWPFGLFLGTLLAICKHETNFRNIRYNGSGGPEYPGRSDGHIPSIVTETAAYNKFVERYANDPKYGLIGPPPGFTQWAVGPMQLYDRAYKEYADRAAGGRIDELTGGRWDPRFNILAGAYALRGHLGGSLEKALDPTNASQAYSLIWQGVAGYGGAERYGREIKAIYDEAFAPVVDTALKSSSALNKTSAHSGWTFEFARQATGGTGSLMDTPAGHQARPFHNWQSDNAYDIGVPVGTSVFSLSAGVVGPRIGIEESDPHDGMRLTVGDAYWYGHLSSIAVKAGQTVAKGQLLGKSGRSKNGVPHLHVGYNDGGSY